MIKLEAQPLSFLSLQKRHKKLDYFLRRYKLWVIVFLIGLTLFHIYDILLFGEDLMLPEPFLLGFLLVGMTFLWLGEMRDRVILENINRVLSELDEMKTRFITIAGHELYTPLAIIKQYTNMMREKLLGELNLQQEKSLGSIERAIERLYNIVSQVLLIKSIAFDRDEHKAHPFKQWEQFDFHALAKSIENDMMPLVQRRNQKFMLSIKDRMASMLAHKEGIQQVITNLVLNAIRFTPDGGRIELHAEETPHTYLIGVRDTGIGISPAEKERIFESFYEVKNPRYHSFGTIEFNSSGLGLGLTICKDIVESHGGKIWVDSELGRYADFTFSIPKKRPEKEPAPTETPAKIFHFPWMKIKKTA